jgi:hypothetical protein
MPNNSRGVLLDNERETGAPAEAAFSRARMRTRIMGRLIGLVVVESTIGVSWLFGINRMLVMVAMIGSFLLAIMIALPVAMLIRSNRSSPQSKPPSNPN